MKNLMSFSFLVVLALAFGCSAQTRTNRLFRPCPGSTTPATVEVQRDGDINLVPCSGRQVQVNGAATSSTFTVSGTSPTNHFPYFSSGTNFAKSPFTWDGTKYVFADAAGTSENKLEFNPTQDFTGWLRVGDWADLQYGKYLSFAPWDGDGKFRVNLSEFEFASFEGSTGLMVQTSPTHTLQMDNQYLQYSNGANSGFNFSSGVNIYANSGTLGLQAQGAGLYLSETAAAISGSVFDTTNVLDYNVAETVTPGGTTGNRTFFTPAGTVNFAAGTSAITITNTIITANSTIFAIPRTNDATCSVKNVVPAAGSAVINMTANCTANTSVGFLITN